MQSNSLRTLALDALRGRDQEMSLAACPACLGSEATVLYESVPPSRETRFLSCKTCGLVRADLLTSQQALTHYYRSQYRKDYKGVIEPKLKHVFRAGHLALNRLATLREYFPRGGEILDIGSGGGEWVYVLGASGFSARGIEVDAGYSAFASRELGVAVDKSSVWDADFEAGRFGAVTLFHVLEHLPDPVRCLQRCASWLRDDGTLVIEVPNMASVHQHPVKRFHFAHVFGFTSESLVMIAARANFVAVRVEIDRNARNILAVFRKAGCAAPASAQTAVSSRPERRSVARYYLTLDTYTRWFRRMWQFSVEYRAVAGAESAAEVLDRVLATRGFARSANPVDPLPPGQR